MKAVARGKAMRAAARRSWRLHGRSILIGIASVTTAGALIRFGVGTKPDTVERALALTVAGAALATLGKTVVDLIMRGEAYKQGSYTERAKAVQRVFQGIREVRELGRVAWAIRNGYAYLTPGATHDEAETVARERYQTSLRELLTLAFTEELWIGQAGVDAVRRFTQAIPYLHHGNQATEELFLEEFNRHAEELRTELRIGLGFWV